MVYFDHNATTPLAPEARQAWLDAAQNFPGNPSSPHRLGSRAEAALTGAREAIAEFLDCPPAEIVWTSGATESNNTVVRHFHSLSPEAEIWVSAIEHPCLREPAAYYFPRTCREIPVLKSGLVDESWIESAFRKKRPALVCVMAANNETGVLQPWEAMASLCQQHDTPFFTDAVQWVGKRPADRLGQAGFVAASAHKFGGPRGIGFL
jgi:cysteine desulfurase